MKSTASEPGLTLYLMHAVFSMMVTFHFRELAFFYPDFVAPTIVQKRKKKRLQRTLALIRPDALRTRKGNLADLNLRNRHLSVTERHK